jgi:hypothetical protein
MTGHVRLTFLCVAFLVGALAVVSSAQAGWSPPLTVAHSLIEEGQVLATSPTQGAAVAWRGAGDHVLRVRRLGPGGTLGRVMKVPGPVYGEPFPRMAIAESGAIVVAWTHWEFETGPILYARRIGKHGKLGAIRTIAHDPEAFQELDERLAMDAAGNATIAWNRMHITAGFSHGDQVTYASVCIRRFTAAGSLGPVTCVPTDGGDNRGAQLAIEPSGRGAFTWTRYLDGRTTVRAMLIGRNGALGPALDVSSPYEYWSGGAAAVAVDGSGRATLAWSTGQIGQGATIRQISNRGLGTPHVFPTSGSTDQPRVAASTSGPATVAWIEDPSYRVKAVHILRSGAVGPVHSLSAPSSVSSTFAFAVAADGLGNTTVAYNAELPRRKPRSVVQARRFSGRGELGKPWNLSPIGPAGLVRAVAVVADERGVVTALSGSGVSRFVP